MIDRAISRRHALAGAAGVGLGLPVLAACGNGTSGSAKAQSGNGGGNGGSGGATLGPTSDVAVVRMHGRNPARWRDRSHGRRSGGWRYLYSHDELADWASRIHALAARTEEVHVIFSNSPLPNAVRNARELATVMAEDRVRLPGEGTQWSVHRTGDSR